MKKIYYIMESGEPMLYCGDKWEHYLVTAASDATAENVMQTVTGQKDDGTVFGPGDDNGWIEKFLRGNLKYMEEMRPKKEDEWIGTLAEQWGTDESDLNYLRGNINYNEKITVMQPEEQIYANRQTTKIAKAAGFLGNAEIVFNNDGSLHSYKWNKSWNKRKYYGVRRFRGAFEKIINSLRRDGSILGNIKYLHDFVDNEPEYSLKNPEGEYGFRIDTNQYSYFMRIRMAAENYSVSGYCYDRVYLKKHMEKAKYGIRFSFSNWFTGGEKSRFTLWDGDSLRIVEGTEAFKDVVCRYVDESRIDAGGEICDLKQFIKRIENKGKTAIPLRESLPNQCYVYIQTENQIGIIKKGESGYYKTGIDEGEPSELKALVDEYNLRAGVNKAQAEAMRAGSMFGWHTPAADPKNYGEDGRPKKEVLKDHKPVRTYERY